MSNMSYCRFNNTLMDLNDCREAMDTMQDQQHNVATLKGYKEKLDAIEKELDELKLVRQEDRDDEWMEQVEDLEDGQASLEVRIDEANDDMETLSEEEYSKALDLLELCKEIGETFDEDDLIKQVTA